MKILKYLSKCFILILIPIILSTGVCISANTDEENIKNIINKFFEIDKLANIDKPIDNINSIVDGENFLNELKSRYEFERQWRDKLDYKILSYNYNLSISISEIKDNRSKVFVIRDLEFIMSNCSKSPQKSQNERYIFILKKVNNKWKLIDYCYEEENPDYFDALFSDDLSESLRNSSNIWQSKLDNIEGLFCEFKSISKCNNVISNYIMIDSSINKQKVCEYAEAYALKRNSLYRDFENAGGDCTNFISQALFYGGLKKTDSWQPYTAPWIRVKNLRDYLVFNGLATELPNVGKNFLGEIVQFSINEYDTWTHSVIITSKLPNDDYLYCCHSYDKLNYPLSKSYPIIYPKIRVLDLN